MALPCGGIEDFPMVTFPYAQVVMTRPPPCLAPTRPAPVEPLRMPCPKPPPELLMTERENIVNRYENYYNNYNIDWHNGTSCPAVKFSQHPCTPQKQRGVTVDGKCPCCPDLIPCNLVECPGCPTGFKPCKMKMCPPCTMHPMDVWCAKIQHCEPKPKCCNYQYKPYKCTEGKCGTCK